MTTNLSDYIQKLRDALRVLLEQHFPDLCGKPCEHIDCTEARKARDTTYALLAEPVPLALHDAQVLRDAADAYDKADAWGKAWTNWLRKRVVTLEAEARKGAAPETGDVLEQERGK